MTNRNNDMCDGTGAEHSSSTSSGLLNRLREKDQEAWRRAARLYAPLVYGWALHVGLQPEDAEDVVQEVFRTVAVRLAEFRRERPGDTFRGWLWSITRHKLGDHIRRQKKQPPGTGGSDAQKRMAQCPADDEEFDSLTSPCAGQLLHRALELIEGEFEDRTWQAFWRLVVEEQRPDDVAGELGMSVNAVYLAKSRILRRLRDELGDDLAKEEH